MLFEGNSDLVVVGDAGDTQHAVRSAAGLRPDIVVLDWHSHALDAVEIVRRMAAESNGAAPPVLVLIDEFDERVHRLLRAGVRGLLLNQSSPAEIVSAVRVVAAGYALLLPGSGKGSFDQGSAQGESSPDSGNVYLGCLTRREADVLRLIARGCSNAEISSVLFVSESTVKSHVQRMLDKLELRNRVHAVIYAYEVGMVRAGAPALAPAAP
uniref:Transcriptional regulator n=1 Tax=Streptomyces sp. CNH287 TaxID=1288082 RepID=U6A125_9ACTN|nr:transcriptional regulator [Streptomyces sp. CNH287]